MFNFVIFYKKKKKLLEWTIFISSAVVAFSASYGEYNKKQDPSLSLTTLLWNPSL
jgi:hypothetical protein